MRVIVIHDDVDGRPDARADDRAVLESVDAICDALGQLGHSPARLPVDSRGDWIAVLTRDGCDCVFNLCEGVGGRSALETAAAGVLELLGVPYTGCRADTIGLARRKDRVNAVLEAELLPVPRWSRLDRAEPASWTEFPAIVKPAAEDASVGIGQHSVARDAAGLAQAIAVTRMFGPVLVQRYVAGREFNVGFIGDQVLPIAEIEFDAMPPDHWPIVSWNAKWASGTVEDVGSMPRCPARLDTARAEHLCSIAAAAWRAVDGCGYGRVDLRLDTDGQPWILEVNPNPDLSPAAGLARMGCAAGWNYTAMIERILSEARP